MALSKQDQELYREVFDDFDADGSGSVSAQELIDMFKALGQNVSQQELDELMQEVDTDGSGEVSFEEFCELMVKKQAESGDVDIETELRDVFRMFDPKDNGYITIQDLRNILKMLNMRLTEDKIQNMIREADSDGDGKVSFEDFRYMYFC